MTSGARSALTRMRQPRSRSGDGRCLLPAFSFPGGAEDVKLRTSTSSTQAMRKKGNWKKEDRHMLRDLTWDCDGFLDGVDAEDFQKPVHVEQDEEHGVLEKLRSTVWRPQWAILVP